MCGCGGRKSNNDQQTPDAVTYLVQNGAENIQVTTMNPILVLFVHYAVAMVQQGDDKRLQVLEPDLQQRYVEPTVCKH